MTKKLRGWKRVLFTILHTLETSVLQRHHIFRYITIGLPCYPNRHPYTTCYPPPTPSFFINLFLTKKNIVAYDIIVSTYKTLAVYTEQLQNLKDPRRHLQKSDLMCMNLKRLQNFLDSDEDVSWARL